MKETLDQALEKGKVEKLYTAIGDSWEQVKEYMGSYIGYVLLYLFIQIAVVGFAVKTYFIISI